MASSLGIGKSKQRMNNYHKDCVLSQGEDKSSLVKHNPDDTTVTRAARVEMVQTPHLVGPPTSQNEQTHNIPMNSDAINGSPSTSSSSSNNQPTKNNRIRSANIIDHIGIGIPSKHHATPTQHSITNNAPIYDNVPATVHAMPPDEPSTARAPAPKPHLNPVTPYVERTLRHIPDTDLEVGSMIEVSTEVMDDNLMGVIRWIGRLTSADNILVGVELDNPLVDTTLDATDGMHRGRRLFKCAPGRGIFVSTGQCTADRRFGDPEPSFSVAEIDEGSEEFNRKLFGDIDCPIVEGIVEPMNIMTYEDLDEICGIFKGIQGQLNSCYLDSTLFGMFAFTRVFDSALYREPDPQDIKRYVEVRDLLCHEIINPLRLNKFVRADRVMKLRKTLGQICSVKGMTTDEMDPEEFLNIMMIDVLKAEPLLQYSNGSSNFCFQLFADKDESLRLPTVQQLLDQSFCFNDLKLREVPKCLLIQMPRFGKSYKMYSRVFPSLLLDVTDSIENAPRQCIICGNVAELECRACFNLLFETTSYCKRCYDTNQKHNSPDTEHVPTALRVPDEYMAHNRGNQPPPRIFMDLFAVVCIETSHYVSFVKTGSGENAPWCFFDSMADRKGGQGGYNVPELVSVEELPYWISEKGRKELELETADVRSLPKLAKRLLCDASLCMYQSRDVMMYQ